jgi:hypothetical protein
MVELRTTINLPTNLVFHWIVSETLCKHEIRGSGVDAVIKIFCDFCQYPAKKNNVMMQI